MAQEAWRPMTVQEQERYMLAKVDGRIVSEDYIRQINRRWKSLRKMVEAGSLKDAKH